MPGAPSVYHRQFNGEFTWNILNFWQAIAKGDLQKSWIIQTFIAWLQEGDTTIKNSTKVAGGYEKL